MGGVHASKLPHDTFHTVLVTVHTGHYRPKHFGLQVGTCRVNVGTWTSLQVYLRKWDRYLYPCSEVLSDSRYIHVFLWVAALPVPVGALLTEK